MANKLRTFFKNLFSRTKELETIGTKQGLPIWSYHPQTGVIRQETGTWLVAAPNMRKASRHFKAKLEKKTGLKATITDAPRPTN